MNNSSGAPWKSIDEFLNFWLENDVLEGADRAEFRSYYANYLKSFGDYTRHYFAEQTREISQQIRAAGAPALLEIGTGCGTEALWFAILGAKVTTIDLNPDRMRVAKARKRWLEEHMGLVLDIEFGEMSVFDFQPTKQFDLIWMEQTYHHIEPREQLGPKLLAMLRPGGHCHICEVNGWNPLLQLLFIKERGFKTKTFFTDEAGNKVPYGNERITTPIALRRSLRRAGFASASSRNYRLLPNSNPPRSWLGVERAILKFLPVLSTHYNVEAVKG